jgi:ribosomal protein L16/L10AE
LRPRWVLTPVAAAHAQTSIACMYMLMRVYKAEMDYCHVPLTKDRADRYERMKAGMEKFIRANAKVDAEKVIAGIEKDNIKRALAGLKSCQSDDFKYAIQAMDQITTPDNEKTVQGSLSYARDPMQGDCSS